MLVLLWVDCEWVDIENLDSVEDDLCKQGYQFGVVLFVCGEGVYWGQGEFYFCCINGGNKKFGQVMCYQFLFYEGILSEYDQFGCL